MSINSDILQQQFKNEHQKAHFNLLYTASWLSLQATQTLKPFKISPQQFYVLRILWEMHPNPVTVKVLTAHMVDKMSNASRLVEKLKQKGLVEREASDGDRRRVNVYITPEGLELIEKAAKAFEESIEKKLQQVPLGEITLLNEMLNQIRG